MRYRKKLKELKKELVGIVGDGCVREDEPMSLHTSFKAGGCADIFVEPESIQVLRDVLKVIAEAEKDCSDIQHIVIGNGSNILVRDGGFRGVVVKIANGFDQVTMDERAVADEHWTAETLPEGTPEYEPESVDIRCGAGALISTVANAAASWQLTGLEFASGIPGSIGGAVFMDAGAYGGEIKDVLVEVKAVSSDGTREFTLDRDELELGYRHSVLQETGDIVTEVVLRLKSGDERLIREKMTELKYKRNSKQPVQYPSAGSFFKRPEGYYAGKLIQDSGCRGLSVGDAEVSLLHCGFIINKGEASAEDILRLKELVQARVMDYAGVMLEPEVRIIGEDRKKQATAGTCTMTYDLHTHTTYSHGKGSIEDNVCTAADKRLEFIAISDHGPGHLFYGVKRARLPEMKKEIDAVRTAYPEVNVRYSVEANIVRAKGRTPNGLDVSNDEIDQFDFVIAGYHFGCLGCYSIRNWLWSHGIKLMEKSLKRKNTRMIVDAIEKNSIAILTHPGDKGPFDIEEIAKACAKAGTLMEINNRHGHLDTEEIKTAAAVEGLEFIISSDAHTPEAVGTYEVALGRAIEAGLDLSRIVNIKEVC